MRRCLNPKLSRSGIHRCMQRHGLSARLTLQTAPAVTFQTDTPAGFIHVDVKDLPPLGHRRSYAYVAIDRATRFVYLEILPDRRAARFLARFVAAQWLRVHRPLCRRQERQALPQPSGDNPFGLSTQGLAGGLPAFVLPTPGVPDGLTKCRFLEEAVDKGAEIIMPDNGMVERFNRRLGEHLDRMTQNRTAHHRRFVDHAERDAYLHTFVANYNRTRLRCLDNQAHAELLAKLAGHNTKAGIHFSHGHRLSPV